MTTTAPLAPPGSEAPPTIQLAQLDRTQLFQQLDTSQHGLASEEAERRLARNGANEPTPPSRFGALRQLVRLVVNPLILLLLVASAVAYLVGDPIDATIILVLVTLSVIIDFIQTTRSQRAEQRLRTQVTPTATVLRDGTWGEQPRRELVPGDLIRLSAGDAVPADARLLEARDLHVQQAALTGEPFPAEKGVTDAPAASSALADNPNVVLMGTSVAGGSGTAVVLATGRSTAFGDIAQRLAAAAPETEFDRGLRQFSLLLARTVIFLVLFVLVVNLVIKHTDPLQTLLFAVALAVGMTPEFLPVVTQETLGQGALRMARKKVIVKHLAAIENFGSMDILGSDKTGTLTSGEMMLDQALDPLGRPSQRTLLLGYVNSSLESGIRNPLDAAILAHGQLDIGAYHKVDEIPYDFERRRLSIVVKTGSQLVLITKGAPESVLPLCTRYEVAATPGQLTSASPAEAQPAAQALDASLRARCQTTYEQLSAQGERVLALAYRHLPIQQGYHVADETDLTLIGYLAFLDPVLPDAAQLLSALHRDGVEVKIVSGDNELVARHVCQQAGMNVGRIVLGDEVDKLGDPALQPVAEKTAVFARVSPAQKNRIMLALKARKHAVGYLGDGINDAPSLHVADVGISVANAVDVAKDAAEVILLERSLQVLHDGVREGRIAFGNVLKYMLMVTSSNFGNMLSMAGAALVLPFLPMTATQVLVNNFLYTISQVAIPFDNVDASLVDKPHHWNVALIRDYMVRIGPVSSIFDFLTFWAMLNLFHASQPLFHTGWFVESLATQTLVVLVIRTMGNPLKSRPSVLLLIAVVVTVLLGLVLPYSPLAGPLGFVPLPPGFFLFLILATAAYLLLVEVVKRRVVAGSV
ncbi:MAG TPA: magnesium-translocating P-type ATPase [Ktedonobacterales bacterium]